LHRKSFLKHVIKRNVEGQIKVTRRRERRRTQLLGDIKVKKRYWNLEDEVLDRTVWELALEGAVDLS
jgi:hypothetical protein